MRFRCVPLGTTCLLLALAIGTGCSMLPSGGNRTQKSIRQSLTFHASFDRGTDADFAMGDPWIYHAPDMNQWTNARPGLPPDAPVRVVPGDGRFGGGALHFQERLKPVVFFRAQDNVPWQSAEWSGTVSFWLKTDRAWLPEGFCDPVQLTPRAWNDAAFFVEFEKREMTAPFRLGAYADFKVWNPEGRPWNDIPPTQRPLITVPGPPFSKDRWTHVAFTWDRFNTRQPDGVVALYLDGAVVGTLQKRTQTFTWSGQDPRLLLGLWYVGLLDDLAVFNRALSPEEIRWVHRLPQGIRSLQW